MAEFPVRRDDAACPLAGKRAFAGGAPNFVDAAIARALYRWRSVNWAGCGVSRGDLAKEIGVMTLAAFVLAIAGPFGTYAAPLWLRFVDWLIFALGGYAFFRPVIAGGDALAAASALPRWAATACACAFAAFPTTVLVCWALAGWRIGAITAADLFHTFPQVLLVGGVVTAIQLALGRRRASGAAVETDPGPSLPAMAPPSPLAPTAPAAAPFLRRLPPSLGGALLCLEMEDHYVRAHLPGGSALILMRLRDAIAELEGVNGARVHRSWWVARAAVAGVERRERALALRLVNGLVIPVARNALPGLRAAGWLDR